MTEKDIQKLFGRYLTKTPPKQSEIYELKICKSRALPFAAVAEHQVSALLKANYTHLYHKIADQPVSFGTQTKIRFNLKKPFDCFVAVKVPAYVVIIFYKPKQKKVLIKIPIEKFVTESQQASRKSLTESRAYEIATELIYI